MLLAVIDWTSIIDALILALPAIIAAIYAGRVHYQVRTPSGQHLGAVVEYAHDTVIANNMLLAKQNGPTKLADHDTLHEEATTAPRIPAEPTKEV